MAVGHREKFEKLFALGRFCGPLFQKFERVFADRERFIDLAEQMFDLGDRLSRNAPAVHAYEV